MPSFIQYPITFLVALVPAAIWMIIFYRKNQTNPWATFFTFVGGIVAAQLILLYKEYWDQSINLLFFNIELIDFRSNISSIFVNAVAGAFVIFLGIGAMEEFAKFLVMRMLNKNLFRSIDDVISLAIVSALGFSFYENMVYFNAQWGSLAIGSFILLILSRITVVTMVHMLCSGVLGYYFAHAHFASPILLKEHEAKKRRPVLRFFKTIFHLKTSHLYRDEMMVVGLLLAMLLHAVYNFILSSTVEFNGLFIAGMILLYFFGGYMILSRLLKKKEDKIELGLLTETADS